MVLMLFDGMVHDGICTAGNRIGDDGAKAIAEALQVPNGSLVTLNLATNAICGLVTYADEFETDGTYDPSGILALAEALKMLNGSLSTLNLSDNYLGPEGATALAEALKVPNMSLVTLDLSGNEICGVDTYGYGTYNSSGILALAEALQVPNGSLCTLNLLKNELGKEGADAIMVAYEQSTSLQSLCGLKSGMTELDLSARDLGPSDAMLLSAELKKGVTTGSLVTLNLSGEHSICKLSIVFIKYVLIVT